jgi:hypothetical protein
MDGKRPHEGRLGASIFLKTPLEVARNRNSVPERLNGKPFSEEGQRRRTKASRWKSMPVELLKRNPRRDQTAQTALNSSKRENVSNVSNQAI